MLETGCSDIQHPVEFTTQLVCMTYNNLFVYAVNWKLAVFCYEFIPTDSSIILSTAINWWICWYLYTAFAKLNQLLFLQVTILHIYIATKLNFAALVGVPETNDPCLLSAVIFRLESFPDHLFGWSILQFKPHIISDKLDHYYTI